MEVIKASVDRFEGEYAVVYSDQDKRRFDIPRSLMRGVRPGARVLVTLENESVSKIEEDTKTTQDARERIRRKYQRLREGSHL